MKAFPDVPILRELGYDFINESVFMFTAPKGAPPAAIKKLDEAFRKAMDDPDVIQILEKFEFEISYRGSEDTRKYLNDAYVRLGKMIKELKVPKEDEK